MEAWWPFGAAVPGDAEVTGFERAVRDAGVQLVALNGFAGDMPAGDRGILSWPGRQQEFLDNLDVLLGLGARLGCRRFNLLYGNRIDACVPPQRPGRAGGGEPGGRGPGGPARPARSCCWSRSAALPRYPLRTSADVLGVLDRLPADSADAARLLADLYHLRVNGEDIPAMLDRVHARIGHVQVADVPGRHEPGTGTADLDGWVAALRRLGYQGGSAWNTRRWSTDGRPGWHRLGTAGAMAGPSSSSEV